MDKNLANHVALVTGASRGIGRAIAQELARRGATVVGTATSAAGAAGIDEYLATESLSGKGVVLNVTDPAQCDAVLGDILEQFGKIDILVNNAGITRDQLTMRMKDDEWDDVLDTNLKAVFRLSRLVLKPMMKARQGRIINVTSVVGAAGNPGQVNYAAAKAGVAGMARALAREIGSRNITVNCVAPGFIVTPMTDVLNEDQKKTMLDKIPAGRFGSPDDIAVAVVYLASNEAGYVTGQTLSVNGGMCMITS